MTDIVDQIVDMVEEVLEKEHKIELPIKHLDEIRDTLDAVLDKYNQE